MLNQYTEYQGKAGGFDGNAGYPVNPHPQMYGGNMPPTAGGQFASPLGGQEQMASMAKAAEGYYAQNQQHAMKHTMGTNMAVASVYPNGPFAGPRESPVLNAMILPEAGLLNRLPLRPSRISPTANVGIITGVTATTGDEPEDCCDDFPEAGLTKMCEFRFPWGQFGRQSRVISLCDLDETDYCTMPNDLVGGPFSNAPGVSGRGNGGSSYPGMSNNMQGGGPGFNMSAGQGNGSHIGMGFQPPMGAMGSMNPMNSTPDKVLFELATAFVRDFSPIAFTGNPANNTAGGGYKEPWGLRRIINTNYTDAETGLPCPAADPLVISYPDATGAATIADDPQKFVQLITELICRSNDIARQSKLGVVAGALVMPSWMFDCVAREWACAYVASCCNGKAVSSTGIDWIQFRDSMLRHKYLLIDGMPIEVICDDSDVWEEETDGTYTGTLYYTPFTVMGGRVPVFYQQYKPWNGPEIQRVISQFAPQGYFNPQVSPNGAWLLFKKTPQNLCVQMAGITKRRFVHHAPYLCFRVEGITCQRMVMKRSWRPGDTSFVNGGKTESAPIPAAPPLNDDTGAPAADDPGATPAPVVP